MDRLAPVIEPAFAMLAQAYDPGLGDRHPLGLCGWLRIF
jgi:hypothetical protein